MLRGQGFQKVTEGLTQQPQTRQHRDVADHVGGVQTLPGDLRTQRLENAIRGRLEGLPAAVMGQQAGAEVVQRLLRQVGLVRGQLQGVLPQQAELQLLQRLGVGQSEHLLEQKNAQDRRHRLVGTTVVVAIQGRELFFVDQRQGVRAKALGPGRLQAPLLGRRHQVAALEQGALRILRTKHQPHPLERKCVTDWYTPIYQGSLIIRAVKGGFLRENQDWKEIEALWEILSPAPELRDHIDTFKRLAELYTVVRNAYEGRAAYVSDLGRKTHGLVQDSAVQGGLGNLVRSVTFDASTVQALRGEKGSDEAKVFNLVRGLRAEIDSDRDKASVLQPLRERAERILEDLENRSSTSLAALDQLEMLAKEKEKADRAAQESGLSARAFGVYWNLKDEKALATAGIAPTELAQEAESLLARFPNAAQNADEQRRLRAALYRPLLGVPGDERVRIVDAVIEILLDTGHDAGS